MATSSCKVATPEQEGRFFPLWCGCESQGSTLIGPEDKAGLGHMTTPEADVVGNSRIAWCATP